MGPTWLLNTELDDRREIWRMIDRLPSHRRIEWLQWCCKEASAGQKIGISVESSTGRTNEVFADATTIMRQGRLTLERAGERLVQMLRGRV